MNNYYSDNIKSKKMDFTDKLSPSHFFIYISKVFRNEKVILGLSERKHLTIHFGTKSKYADIHIKNELEQDKNKTYEPIIKISHFSLIRLYLISRSEVENQIRLSFSNTINKG